MRSFVRPSATHPRPYWQWWSVLCCGARSTRFFRLDDHAGAGGRRQQWRRRTSERRPFFHQSNQHYWRVMKTPVTDSLTSHRHEKTHVACSLLHGCVCMYDSQCVSMCNAMKTYSLHNLFYERRVMWYDCPCTRYDEEVVDVKVLWIRSFKEVNKATNGAILLWSTRCIASRS